MKQLKDLVRDNIWTLKPYSSARDEYKGVSASVFLDANESPFNAPINRYPDPLQLEVKKLLSPIKRVPVNQIFLGNGSDEAIDLLYRVFCVPGRDNVVAIDPTYGMYEVCANVNDVEYRKVLLDDGFQFKADSMLGSADENTKLMFLCSPNNPTGNLLDRNEIIKLIEQFQGIVVLDEAYSDFAKGTSFRSVLSKYPNLVIMQTFSKAWGAAAMRLGVAFASEEIIELLNKVKYPYNVNALTQKQAISMLSDSNRVDNWVNMIVSERAHFMQAFSNLPICVKVYPSDANFFLAKVTDANAIYSYLVNEGIIVRNRTKVTKCLDCLRITVGTVEENSKLLVSLIKYKS